MADANILKALNEQQNMASGSYKGNASLDKLILFGKVRCAIERPKMIGGSIDVASGGAFAILDTFGVKCLGEDYFQEPGMNSSRSIYYTKGSVLIYIDSQKWVGKYVKVSGAYPRSGVKLKQQYGHKEPNDGVAALVFSKGNYRWEIVPNNVQELGVKDPDIKITPLEDFVIKLYAEDKLDFPSTVDSILPYKAVSDYVELKHIEGVEFVDDDERVDVSKIDLHLTYHLDAKPRSPLYEDIVNDIWNMSKNRTNYSQTLLGELYDYERMCDVDVRDTAKNIRNAFADRVATKYSMNIGTSRVKGKQYIDEFLIDITGDSVGTETGKKPSMNALKNSADTLSNLIKIDPMVLKENYIPDIDIPLLSYDMQVALIVISITTGIPMSSLRSNYSSCHREVHMEFDLWFYCLLHIPYVLGMIGGNSMSIVNCDKVYLSYTKYFTSDDAKDKCKDLRGDLLYLQTLENADSKNSLVPKRVLARQKAKYPSLGLRYLEQNAFPAKSDYVEVLSCICGMSVKLDSIELKKLRDMQWYSGDRTEKLINRGLVNSVDDSLILERDYEKEFLIYDVLQRMGTLTTGITDEQVVESIEKFEQSRGFKLEKLQKDGILLCKYRAGVLSGCAGSGKTTTSDCITECLKDNLDMENYSIVYGAPTGKACRRLAEVVGGTVKTFHSRFGIGLDGEGYLSKVGKRNGGALVGKSEIIPKNSIYICDEMAMCNTPLLYEIVRNLRDNDIIYFLGDIKQLPPIGKGNPFYLLMQMLPCVELGVSKRAAEGSEVNYNTTLINCMSDGVLKELKYDDSTFFGIECDDANIPSAVTTLWQKFMDGSMNGTKYKEEDIQVITGYAKPEVLFSTAVLNKPLQNVLRRNDKLLFTNYQRNFYQNERVIHVKANCYGVQRYIQTGDGEFHSIVTLGIVNGEMGTLVDIVRSDRVKIIDFDSSDYENTDIYKDIDEESFESILFAREERIDSIRDDSAIHDENTYFVQVKVYDVDLKRDVYVFYVARCHMQDGEIVLSGSDLENLDLAYALTTHKMQGSQSPVVILPFGSNCNSNFINRNMINTMVTRSQGIVAMIGSIKGADSPVNKGRRIPSPIETSDLFSVLCE